MTMQRFLKPPTPSTPREAPWIEVEEVIAALNAVTTKLDQIITTLQQMPSLNQAALSGRLDALIGKLDQFITLVQTTPLTGGPLVLDGRLDSIAEYLKNKPGWTHGHHIISTAGKAQSFPDIVVPDGFPIVIRALPDNTTDAYVGKSEAAATRSNERITLAPGEAIKEKVTNANLFFGDVATSGEGFEYFVEQD